MAGARGSMKYWTECIKFEIFELIVADPSVYPAGSACPYPVDTKWKLQQEWDNTLGILFRNQQAEYTAN